MESEMKHFEVDLEHRFEEAFGFLSRDLRGTEMEIMAVKASMHQWFFLGAYRMQDLLVEELLKNNRTLAAALDSSNRR